MWTVPVVSACSKQQSLGQRGDHGELSLSVGAAPRASSVMWTAPQNNYPAHAPASASGWSRPPQRPHSPPPPEGAARAAGIPEPPATFPDIAAMPLRDLEALAGDAARFDDYVSRHPHQKCVSRLSCVPCGGRARLLGELCTDAPRCPVFATFSLSASEDRWIAC